MAPAPALPRFLRDALPYSRKLFVPPSGQDRGREMHLIDHGPANARVTVWLQHGNPTWSFLWRKVLARLPTDELRIIVPDLYGLGLSSKHLGVAEHQVDRHLDALEGLFAKLGLDRVIWVGQDWGGPMVAGLAARHPSSAAGLLLMNTSVRVPRRPRGTAFHRFARLPVVSDLAFRGLGFPQRDLSRAQGDPASMRGLARRAYRWPLRSLRGNAAPLGMARMVPDGPDHPSVPALRPGTEWVQGYGGPIELVWGTRDPILGRAIEAHESMLPSARVTRCEAGHFLQEEVPDLIAEAILRLAK